MNPDKIRNVLNILFMILAVAAIITYFVAKDDFKMFIYVYCHSCGVMVYSGCTCAPQVLSPPTPI